jgi:hypothetical protein
MTEDEFENLVSQIAAALDTECKQRRFTSSPEFERRVRELVIELGEGAFDVDLEPHPHVFPDIALGEFGIEVKFTKGDSWRSVGNSILESSRNEEIAHIYLIYGKMGGDLPGVRWGRYEDCVMHVRTSHALRFEVQVPAERSLFDEMAVEYDDFRRLPLERKMTYIRDYARARLKAGERLWWLPDDPEETHSLPIEARLYMSLPQTEKRKLRAEAALLSPQIVKPSRAKHKYDDAVLYLLTYHGVLCPQARDLFSAGSVALRGDQTRGGNYVQRALLDIEEEMIAAAGYLEDSLFVEYWGEEVPPAQRITKWLENADRLAGDWVPSDVLFKRLGR